jgi:hypothetical protein
LGMVMSRAKVRGWKEVRCEDALGANSTATSAGRRSGREGRRPGRSRVTPYLDGVREKARRRRWMVEVLVVSREERWGWKMSASKRMRSFQKGVAEDSWEAGEVAVGGRRGSGEN